MSILAGVAVAIAAALILWYLYPDAVERWLVRILTAKRVVFGVGAVILSLFLLSTGSFGLMVLGGVILALIVWYLLEDPDGIIADYT